MSVLSSVSVFTVLLFGLFGIVHAEQVTDHVVINEVDTNPPGDDAKTIAEWVELYNPTQYDVDIGGWKIASTTVTKKAFTISPGTIIKSGQFLVYSNTSLWFTDVSEKVQLKDKDGKIVDETIVLTDKENDFTSWQRKFDGADSADSETWIFKKSSAGSSNGKPDTKSILSDDLVISVMTDKKNYLFDETLTISGSVSKQIYQEKPYFKQEQISIHVDGPGKYDRYITLYPDLNLQYKSQINLNKVLGTADGAYVVTVKYGDASTKTTFFVGEEITSSAVVDAPILTISTDKQEYLPGQTVLISATTTSVLPHEGLTFSVYDPKKILIFSGKLFPTKSGEFRGNIYMNTVKPVYGMLSVVADYGDQHAKTTFDLVKDIKDTDKIILSTDKKTYVSGEAIKITGRSNKHVVALDLDVIQTGTGSIGKTSKNIFKISDQVKLAGDSTFSYTLNVPEGNYGDFRVMVSKGFGKTTTEFKIVEDHENLTYDQNKYFIKTDKEKYLPGDIVYLNGHAILKERSTFGAIPVYISLMDAQGKQITMTAVANKQLKQDKVIQKSTIYSFTTIPDAVGNFKMDFKINPASFKPGMYVIRASYDQRLTDTTFMVDDDQIDITNPRIVATTNKTIYGLGETIYLDGTLASGQSSVKIILIKPDGRTTESGAKLDNSRFTWSWIAPAQEYSRADISDSRQQRPSVFGTYNISVIATSERADLSFKILKNPTTDSVAITPLTVKTDKTVYAAGEKLVVFGNAINRQENIDTSIGTVRDRIGIEVRTMSNKIIFDSNLDLNRGGEFQTTYDLPLTIFKDGKYKIVTTYQKLRAYTTFEVKNNTPIGNSGKTTITLQTDKEKYLPGDTVHITGSINKVLFLNNLNLVVNLQKDNGIDCDKLHCGLGGKEIDISRSYNNGFYSYDYKIPSNSALGTYVIKMSTEFGTFTDTFQVTNNVDKKPLPTFKTTEKFNRITDSVIQVELFEQIIDEQSVGPNILRGSLATLRGSENSVNLVILADDGQCIIGQNDDCLISKSTKKDNVAYDTIAIAGIDYNVTYSGHDQILEKFSITPKSEGYVIPDSIWIIEITKEEGQSSKLYYEIVYNTIQ